MISKRARDYHYVPRNDNELWELQAAGVAIEKITTGLKWIGGIIAPTLRSWLKGLPLGASAAPLQARERLLAEARVDYLRRVVPWLSDKELHDEEKFHYEFAEVFKKHAASVDTTGSEEDHYKTGEESAVLLLSIMKQTVDYVLDNPEDGHYNPETTDWVADYIKRNMEEAWKASQLHAVGVTAETLEELPRDVTITLPVATTTASLRHAWSRAVLETTWQQYATTPMDIEGTTQPGSSSDDPLDYYMTMEEANRKMLDASYYRPEVYDISEKLMTTSLQLQSVLRIVAVSLLQRICFDRELQS